MTPSLPPRFPWQHFPDVVLHSSETAVKKHPAYRDAKSGDAEAAALLCRETVSSSSVDRLLQLINQRSAILAAAQAYETDGVNAIPQAFATLLASALGLEYETGIVQTNAVGHTGADGFTRLARQAAFDGPVVRGALYFLVDDFVGQGGTLANMRGYILSQGSEVIGATALTGKSYSTVLSTNQDQIIRLEAKHGRKLEQWWQERFGHAFDCLTQSEARYLERSSSFDTIRDRIASAEQT
jgi:adenine/guanine phosphoribosyltransferase-like PRPP-binding protein